MAPTPDQVKMMLAERRSLPLLASSQNRKARVPVTKVATGRKISLRNTGRLKQFLDLPLDVIFAVSTLPHVILLEWLSNSLSNKIAGSFNEPRDLLSLSRVTKEFRALFMSRTSRVVWREALESVRGLPPCPPDLTEPQYASLLFEQYCFVIHSASRSVMIFFKPGIRNAASL
ncbi:hypothetical protein FPV67DRAFT_1225260 [Lyophyllum atratum]|nr:hypothetical protein FPV67DRAFT_1225260 [Lyophyllum atratum]